MKKLTPEYTKRYILACRDEAESAKRDRMAMNKENYESYQLKHDFSHKREGQSQEVLPKTRMAVEQIKSFFQQALVDLGEWWRAVARDGSDGDTMVIKPEEVQKLTNYMLKKANYYSHVGNSVQSALIGSLAITKPAGCMKPKPKYVVKESGRGKAYKKSVEATDSKSWELTLGITRQENYYPDPTGESRYEVEDSFIDLASLRKYATEDEYSTFNMTEINKLKGGTAEQSEEDAKRADENGQNPPTGGMRPRVKLTSFIGDIVDDETGEILMENCVATLANDDVLIQNATPNPYWHQRSPTIAAPLIEVANSVWHVALMDAPTKLNQALIEIFNLIVDSAMMSVHGIKQVHTSWLLNPKEAANGFKFGDTIQVNDQCPAGAKALEAVVTGEISPQALNVMNIIAQEENAAALTNDLRQGVMPFRAVKATEVVEASNTITSVFQGIAKNVESKLIQPELEMAWMTTAQNWDRIDKEVFISLFGPERGEKLSQLSPQDVFVATVNGIRFEVFGITLTLGKSMDFRKYMTLLQSIGSSEVLIEEFAKKYDFGKLLGEILTSLDIDKHKIAIPEAEQKRMAASAAGPNLGAQGGAPQQMSQVPQAGAGSLADVFSQPNFPGSPALAGQGQ